MTLTLVPPAAAPASAATLEPGAAALLRHHEVAVVVLTQGDRPAELQRAVASVRAQRDVDLQLVLVVNGTTAELGGLPALTAADRLVVLPENVGIPAGRNLGAAAAQADLLLFLDDDAALLGPDVLAAVVRRFSGDARLGAMAIRLVDEEGLSQRRHVPRVGSRSAARSGPVTHFIGAACVVRAVAFAAVEGFDRQFFYAMEESDLSYRLLDADWSIWYSADLLAFHPRTTPSRHPGYVLLTARNRFWTAWRSLPVPVLVGHLLVWTVLAVVRGSDARQVVAGYRQAWLARPRRRSMRWRTVGRMTLLGRPPVI